MEVIFVLSESHHCSSLPSNYQQAEVISLALHKMAVGVRTMNMLKEFEPFGLIVEAADNGRNTNRKDGKYQYMLFDPRIMRPQDDDSCLHIDDCEHELIIHGKHLIWSSGPQVFKRFSAPSTIIKDLWCHLESISEPLLCVLHLDSLTAYTPSGKLQTLINLLIFQETVVSQAKAKMQ